MSCQIYENELFESFGTNNLSDELQEHLKSCTSCQKIYENLHTVSETLGTDELFYDTDEIVAQRVEAVNDKIDQLELSKVVDVSARWKAYVPMAAAIVLVLGIGLITKILLQFNDPIPTADNNTTELLFVSLTDDDRKSLTEIDFDEFIDDYTAEFGLDNEMSLLDDISEEEFKYLEENLDIGEIL